MLLHFVGQLVLQPSLALSQTNVNRDAKQAVMHQLAQLSGRKEKKRKGKTTPFGGNLVRSPV